MRVRYAGFAIAFLAGATGATAQPVPAGNDWSGFYVAGLVGGTNSQSNVKTTAGVLQYLDATDARQIARVGDNDLEDWRPSGGLAGGYGRQFGNIVIGIEASANSLFLDEDHVTRQEMDANPGSQSTIRQSVSADWMATLRPRLGWAQDNWLGYVTGGIAVTRLKLDTLYTDNAFSGLSQGSKSELVTGWSAGLGGEYALDQGWSLRGEYLYTRFDQINLVSNVTSTNNSGGTLNHSGDLDTHGLFIGAVYHFTGP